MTREVKVGLNNRKTKMSVKAAFGWLMICVSACMLGRSIALCFSQDIWYDELFTVGMIEHSYGELVRFTAADVHPPLYYCIVKLFSDLCKLIIPQAGTVVPAKLASVLPYFMLSVYSVTFIRKRFGIFTGGMFLFSVVAMPQMSAYTVEVRMYGWALLFVTAAFLHAYGCVTAKEAWSTEESRTADSASEAGSAAAIRNGKERRLHGAALALYGLAAAYTQYFALVAVVMVYLYVLVMFWCREKTRLKEWLVYVGVSIIGYVPWLFALAGQISAVSENYWILPLTWRSLGGCVKFLMKPAFADEMLNTVLAVILFAGYVAVVGICVVKNVKLWQKSGKLYHNSRVFAQFSFALAGLGVLIGLVLFGFAASLLIRPVFVYRYMLPAMGCFWLCLAVCLEELLCAWPSKASFAVAAGMSVLLLAVGLRDYRAFLGEEKYKIRLMKDTEQALSMIGPEDIVIYNFDQVGAVTSYYMEDTVQRFLWNTTAEPLIQKLTGDCGIVEDVQTIREWTARRNEDGETERQRIWFVGSFNSRDDIVAEWQDNGLVVEEKGSYLLERYWFNLYEICPY